MTRPSARSSSGDFCVDVSAITTVLPPPNGTSAMAALYAIPRDSRRTSRSALRSSAYGSMRQPPIAGPRTVLCNAMIARSPQVGSEAKTTSSWESKASQENTIPRPSGIAPHGVERSDTYSSCYARYCGKLRFGREPGCATRLFAPCKFRQYTLKPVVHPAPEKREI